MTTKVPRELSGSKGRMAIGGVSVALLTAAAAALKQLPENVAIAVVVMTGLSVIAYTYMTGREDEAKHNADAEKAKAQNADAEKAPPDAKETPGS